MLFEGAIGVMRLYRKEYDNSWNAAN